MRTVAVIRRAVASVLAWDVILYAPQTLHAMSHAMLHAMSHCCSGKKDERRCAAEEMKSES